MSGEALELINLRRQMEIKNALLQEILEEMKRFNENFERLNEHDL